MSAIQKKNAFLLILRTVIDIFCYNFFFTTDFMLQSKLKFTFSVKYEKHNCCESYMQLNQRYKPIHLHRSEFLKMSALEEQLALHLELCLPLDENKTKRNLCKATRPASVCQMAQFKMYVCYRRTAADSKLHQLIMHKQEPQ